MQLTASYLIVEPLPINIVTAPGRCHRASGGRTGTGGPPSRQPAFKEFSPCSLNGSPQGGGMTRTAALKLARLLRAQGCRVRVRRRRGPGGCFYTVDKVCHS